MREIKFKVFCKKHNREEIYTLGDLITSGAGSENGEGGIFENWRQYTGLKDKNGKEIYEGDIVLYEDWEMSTESGYGDNFINKGVIEYIEENCCFNVTERQTAELANVLYEDNETLEVIGNIYDNPELLEEEIC